MSQLIGSDSPLSPEGEATLRALIGTIIPASDEYAVPGADDALIFADILASARPFFEFLEESMGVLDERSGPTGFVDLDPSQRLLRAEQFRLSHPEATGIVVTLIGQCYYRDKRVMESLGMEARAPFPEGFRVPQGDWSLLDPVRARGTLYKQVP